jgi:hydroxymethylbilane synthase
MKVFRVGTRQSPLALAQTRILTAAWEAAGIETELVAISTRGDQVLDRALDQVGGQGLFTTELEQALLEGRLDCAVHSLKDLPTRLPEGLRIGAVGPREDARDCFLAARPATLDGLAPGSRLGTSSLRRTAMLRAAFPALEVVPVRGNLNTRWDKQEPLQLAGLVLAAAGVIRLGWQDRIQEFLDPGWMVPAPGQGALAVEVRADDPGAERVAGLVHDPVTAEATAAERALLDWLGGNCQLPFGAYASRAADGRWTFAAWVGARDGSRSVSRSWEGLELARGRDWVLEEFDRAGAARLVTA